MERHASSYHRLRLPSLVLLAVAILGSDSRGQEGRGGIDVRLTFTGYRSIVGDEERDPETCPTVWRGGSLRLSGLSPLRGEPGKYGGDFQCTLHVGICDAKPTRDDPGESVYCALVAESSGEVEFRFHDGRFSWEPKTGGPSPRVTGDCRPETIEW